MDSCFQSGYARMAGGGHVLSPEPGLHRNVWVFDFKSLYPSLIRSFQIDPLGHLPEWREGDGSDPIVAPNGAAFRRDSGTGAVDRPRRHPAD